MTYKHRTFQKSPNAISSVLERWNNITKCSISNSLWILHLSIAVKSNTPSLAHKEFNLIIKLQKKQNYLREWFPRLEATWNVLKWNYKIRVTKFKKKWKSLISQWCDPLKSMGSFSNIFVKKYSLKIICIIKQKHYLLAFLYNKTLIQHSSVFHTFKEHCPPFSR